MHGTTSPQRKQQIDAASLAAYLVVVATAAIVISTHPKPDLIPLLLVVLGAPALAEIVKAMSALPAPTAAQRKQVMPPELDRRGEVYNHG